MVSVASTVAGFVLRQVLQHQWSRLQHWMSDPAGKLPAALNTAADHTWQAVELALHSDTWSSWLKQQGTARRLKGAADQLRCFMKDRGDEFRHSCWNEFCQAKKKGHLGTVEGVLLQQSQFASYFNPHQLMEQAPMALQETVNTLQGYPNLQMWLSAKTGGALLLVTLYSHFFRQAVGEDEQLARELQFDALEGLSELLVQVYSEQLDLHSLLEGLQSEQNDNHGELLAIMQQVFDSIQRIDAKAYRGEVKPHYSCSLHSDAEKTLVKKLLAQFRTLPEAQQQQWPTLLNQFGKLEIAVGNFQSANQVFTETAQVLPDSEAKAEVLYNAHRAALEQRDFASALTHLVAAAQLAPPRFEPFPLRKYEPQRILGAGGFGTAYYCQHRVLHGKTVAIKTLHTEVLERQQSDIRVEANLLNQLNHPSIIQVNDFDDIHGRPFIEMEYFDGPSLEAYLKARGQPLTLTETKVLAHLIAEGLAAAHQQQVLHLDIKPSNILVRKKAESWQIKLIDFGLATRQLRGKSTQVASQTISLYGATVGFTELFAPPEQRGLLPNTPVNRYSDVYAFGQTLVYSLLLNTKAAGRKWKALAQQDSGFIELIERCTEYDPPDRYDNFILILNELDRLLGTTHAVTPTTHLAASQVVASQASAPVPEESFFHLPNAEDNLQGWSAERVQARQRQTAQVLSRNVIFQDRPFLVQIPNTSQPRQVTPPALVIIPPGTFVMGSPEAEEGRFKIERQHSVTIKKPFAIGRYAVTCGEFEDFVVCGYQTEGERQRDHVTWQSPGYPQDVDHPVVCVSWNDAVAYCQWLSTHTGQMYRLATEAEWEYACRAGTHTAFSCGPGIHTHQANYDGNYLYGGGGLKGEWRKQTVPVTHFQANPWGLYQMHGNVWEWTGSLYDDGYQGGELRGVTKPSQVAQHVCRGGSWECFPHGLRSAIRNSGDADHRANDLGFRLVRDLL